MTIAMQPIYTQTVGSGGVASVTFNNIPQTFTDLKVVISGRVSASTGYLGFFPNNNTSGIYSYIYIGMNPVAGTAYTGVTANSAYGFFAYNAAASNVANSFSNNEFYIPNYTGSNYKSCILDGVSEDNAVGGNSSISPSAFLMNNTAPITSIVVKDTVTSSNLVQYTTISLYGITKG